MKFYVPGLILFSLLFSVCAKPGGTYVLTGREKSIFGIFQADMKAYPDLYRDADVNACYQAFKQVNNLEGRKLERGQELTFPHTEKSREIFEAEQAKAARKARAAERLAERERALKAAAENPAEPGECGSAPRSETASPEAERMRAEAQRKRARQNAVYHFQHTLLPALLLDESNSLAELISIGMMDGVVEKARMAVDAHFAEALVLHRFPQKNLYVLEFETPEKVNGLFFLALKRESGGPAHLYALEKGVSFFGTGDVSKFSVRKSGRGFSEPEGRSYSDLAGFVQEIEAAGH